MASVVTIEEPLGYIGHRHATIIKVVISGGVGTFSEDLTLRLGTINAVLGHWTAGTTTGGDLYLTAPSTLLGANFTNNSTVYVALLHSPV